MTSQADLSAKLSLITATDDFLKTINESKMVGNSDKSRMEDALKPTLCKMPLEGSGRGKGWGCLDPSLSGGTVGLGEVFGSAWSLSSGLVGDKEAVGFKSRSPRTTIIHSSTLQSLQS